MDVQKSQIVRLLARQFSHPLGLSGIAGENTLKVLRDQKILIYLQIFEKIVLF